VEGGPRRPRGAAGARVIGVLVSGEGTNLQALLDAGAPVVAVASNRRGVRALDRADRARVPTAAFVLDDHPDRAGRDAAMADWLAGHGVRLVVCAGYMHLLTPAFLERFPVINVHPSLLPAFPGTTPIEDALAAGVAETGVTVHFVDEGIDTGPPILQEAVPVQPGDTSESLRDRIHAVEHRLLPEAVRLYLTGALRS
jgi:phosphoribosylglycinamide formyltransferase 1